MLMLMLIQMLMLYKLINKSQQWKSPQGQEWAQLTSEKEDHVNRGPCHQIVVSL